MSNHRCTCCGPMYVCLNGPTCAGQNGLVYIALPRVPGSSPQTWETNTQNSIFNPFFDVLCGADGNPSIPLSPCGSRGGLAYKLVLDSGQWTLTWGWNYAEPPFTPDAGAGSHTFLPAEVISAGGPVWLHTDNAIDAGELVLGGGRLSFTVTDKLGAPTAPNACGPCPQCLSDDTIPTSLSVTVNNPGGNGCFGQPAGNCFDVCSGTFVFPTQLVCGALPTALSIGVPGCNFPPLPGGYPGCSPRISVGFYGVLSHGMSIVVGLQRVAAAFGTPPTYYYTAPMPLPCALGATPLSFLGVSGVTHDMYCFTGGGPCFWHFVQQPNNGQCDCDPSQISVSVTFS